MLDFQNQDVTISDIENLTLNQIIDTYGEPKIINDIETVVQGKYSKVHVLTDANATVLQFITLLNGYNYTEHQVDIALDLHASDDLLVFANNENIGINDLIGQINDLSTIKGNLSDLLSWKYYE